MLEFIISMESETGEVCFFLFVLFGILFMQKQYLMDKINICIEADNICR